MLTNDGLCWLLLFLGLIFSFILLKESPCYEVYFKNLRQVLDNERSINLSQALKWLSNFGSNLSDNLATK